MGCFSSRLDCVDENIFNTSGCDVLRIFLFQNRFVVFFYDPIICRGCFDITVKTILFYHEWDTSLTSEPSSFMLWLGTRNDIGIDSWATQYTNSPYLLVSNSCKTSWVRDMQSKWKLWSCECEERWEGVISWKWVMGL